MDFSLDETQQGIHSLSKRILTDLVTEESLRVVGDDYFHTRAWQALAEAGLLQAALPEDGQEGGAGPIGLSLLLRQVGRAVAPIPALSTLAMAAPAIMSFGSDEQKRRWLPGVCAGETFLTAALSQADTRLPASPSVRAVVDGSGHKLEGSCSLVPGLPRATRVLVPARLDDGIAVFVVDPVAAGVTLSLQHATNDEPLHDMKLEAVRAEEMLGDVSQGTAVVQLMARHTSLGVCALLLGVSERALFMTASYSAERQQFGKPIGSFQAVGQRAADAYIDLAAMKVSLWQAAWQLAQGSDGPQLARALDVARYWAAEGSQRVVGAAQHIHGGIGFDRDYPVHRSFLWARRLCFVLGSSGSCLADLGADLAAEARE